MVYQTFDITSSQDDLNWCNAKQSNGKVGMIPSNYVKQRGEYTGEAVNTPQAPPKAEAKIMDAADPGEASVDKPDKQGEAELADIQVRFRPYKQYEYRGWCLIGATISPDLNLNIYIHENSAYER